MLDTDFLMNKHLVGQGIAELKGWKINPVPTDPTGADLVESVLFYVEDVKDFKYYDGTVLKVLVTEDEIYDQAAIDQLFADLVNSAPADLDTLGDIATAIAALQGKTHVPVTIETNSADYLAVDPATQELTLKVSTDPTNLAEADATGLLVKPDYFSLHFLNTDGSIEPFLQDHPFHRRFRVKANTEITPPAGKFFSILNHSNNYVNLAADEPLPVQIVNRFYDIQASTANAIYVHEIHEPNSFVRYQTNGGTANTVDLNVAGVNALPFDGIPYNKAFGEFNPFSNAAIQSKFSGYVEVSYSLPHTSTGDGAGLRTYIRRTRAGVSTEWAFDFSHFNATQGKTDQCSQGFDIIDCQVNDVFNLIYTQAVGATADPIFIKDRASLCIKKHTIL